jgi:hypothetical protein
MFFLLRCLFWLGLAFSHIAALEGTNATTLARQGASQMSESASGLGRAAMDAAGQQCRAEPEKCLAFAAQVTEIGKAATLGKAVAKNSLAASVREVSSHDTLASSDRIPAWRLRTE